MNPAAGGVLRTVTKGYSPAVLKKAAPVVTGVLLNTTVGRWVGKQLPPMFQDGFLSVAVNLGTAGLLGWGAGVVNRRWQGPVFFGGVLEAVTRVATEYVLPAIGLQGCAGCGLGDYATQMITGEYLPGYYQTSGINRALGDYLTPANAASARPLGDYLTPADAAGARSLGYMEGVEASELV